MIILWNGMLLKCDVKALNWKNNVSKFYHRHPSEVADGVQLVSVNPITYEISFPPNKTPAGWETFWL